MTVTIIASSCAALSIILTALRKQIKECLCFPSDLRRSLQRRKLSGLQRTEEILVKEKRVKELMRTETTTITTTTTSIVHAMNDVQVIDIRPSMLRSSRLSNEIKLVGDREAGKEIKLVGDGDAAKFQA